MYCLSATNRLQDGGTHSATLLAITSSSSSNSILRNSIGRGPRVMIRGYRAEKIESEKGIVWQGLREYPRWRPHVLES
jgi:hypothetical protein